MTPLEQRCRETLEGSWIVGEGVREFCDSHDEHGMGAEDLAWAAPALELLDPSNASADVPSHRA